MTKQQWEHLQKQEHLSMEDFHAYYLERGGKLYNFQEFAPHFTKIMHHPMIILTNGRPRKVTHESAIIQLYNYYNEKFKDTI